MYSIKKTFLSGLSNSSQLKTLTKFNFVNINLVEKFLEDFNNCMDRIISENENCPEEENKLKSSSLFDLNNYSDKLREKIFNMYKTTPYVLRSEIEDEFYFQDGIKYLLKFLKTDQLSKKEVLIGNNGLNSSNYINSSNSQYQPVTPVKPFNDPFAPPFAPDQVIEDNFGDFGTHRVFFSKFAVMAEHMLLVTKEFVSQYSHLTHDDIKNAILFMKVLNGPIFFNGGKNSGASQPRKHMQSIPFKSMYNKEFGIFLLINNENELENITLDIESMINSNLNYSGLNYQLNTKKLFEFCKINKFSNAKINHVLVKFSDSFKIKLQNNLNSENIEDYSSLILYVYNLGLNYLNLMDDEVEIIDKHYSVILTTEWLLLIPRKTHEVPLQNGDLNINTIGFLLTVLVRNEKLLEEVKVINILEDVFSHL